MNSYIKVLGPNSLTRRQLIGILGHHGERIGHIDGALVYRVGQHEIPYFLDDVTVRDIKVDVHYMYVVYSDIELGPRQKKMDAKVRFEVTMDREEFKELQRAYGVKRRDITRHIQAELRCCGGSQPPNDWRFKALRNVRVK